MDVKITDEMLEKMLILYANEQAQLNARIKELDSAIHKCHIHDFSGTSV